MHSILLVVAASLAFAEEASVSPVSNKTATRKLVLHQVEQNVLDATNAQRARHGLPALVLDESLMESARRHCTWMTRNHTLTHTSAAVAENIAMGQRTSAEAVRDWMNSSGHRANILSPRHRRIGVAAFTARDGSIFWCQQFLH
jgi:uncharacterized protein YkwD